MFRKTIKRLADIILCWDFILSALVSILHFITNTEAALDSLRETSTFGAVNLIVILTILFAVFAIIAATSTNEFINYLKDQGVYDGMIWRFSYVAHTTSFSIIYSLFILFLVDVDVFQYAINNSLDVVLMSLHSINVFAIFYSFCCVVNVAAEMILFSKLRAQFIRLKTKTDPS